MTHLLLVSTDRQLHLNIGRPLKGRGFRTTTIESADSLSASVAIHRPDVVLIDVIAESSGWVLEVCRRFRDWNSIPVIISSVRTDVQAKIEALDAGADDYLVKPFDLEELLARIRAVQRRIAPRPTSPTPVAKAGHLTINFDSRLVRFEEQPINLSHKEYEMLRALVLASGDTLTYHALFQTIGGKQYVDERSAVRLIIHRLRTKLSDNQDIPTYILTESGIGYRFNPNLFSET